MNPSAIRILLIEDNPTDARLLAEMLRETAPFAFELVWMDRLAKALDYLAHNNVDVTLADLSLPDATGLDTVIRTRQQNSDLPIIVLTGSSSDEKAIAALRAGAQDYLIKGWADSELIIRTVRYAIERKRTEAELARYARELQARNEQIQSDLLLAREIQLALLPHSYPIYPPNVAPEQSIIQFHHHYQPAAYLAGDFFDVFSITDTRVGVFICDVMGHGIRAALITAMIRPLVDELTSKASDPDVLLGEINQELVAILRQANSTVFATAFYMVMDLQQRRLCYANAGHPSPLILQPHRNRVIPIPSHQASGPALGLFPNSVYSTIQSPIESGDTLFLYTDGLFEATNANEEEYGLQRLQEAIQQRLHQPPRTLFTELLADVQQFTGTKEFPDDVCLLGIEMR